MVKSKGLSLDLIRYYSVSGFWLVIILFFYSCQPANPWKGFDSQSWKTDNKGCDGARLKQYEWVLINKNELMGKSSTDVKAIFGKPNENELYTRSQRFFHYDILNGQVCDNGDDFWRLSIRFDALNRVNEISLWKK